MNSPLVVGFRCWTGVEEGGRFSDYVFAWGLWFGVGVGGVEIGGMVTCGLG